MADTSNAQTLNQTTLPLLIGVTGHRDILDEDKPDLKQKIRAIIDHLHEEYPRTPLMLVSALADGADRLAAEAALDAGIELVVPLPMSQELYEQDFSPESVSQFRYLLAQAVFSLELPLENGNSEAAAAEEISRDLQYLAVGRFIVEQSQVLIALWDGATNGPSGGTSHVVRMQLYGADDSRQPGISLFNPVQTGVVYYVPTRRTNASNVSQDVDFIEKHRAERDAPAGVQLLYPLTDDGKGIREDEHLRTLACIELFNGDSNDIYRLVPDFDDRRKEAAKYVIPIDQPPFTQADLSPSARQLLHYFTHADVLSQQFQKETYSVLLLLASLVPFIVFFGETYTNVTTAMFAISGYLLFLGLAYGIYSITHRQGAPEKFLDYRALAEGMRVSLFWQLAGVSENPASFYLSKQQSELNWIRYAVKTWNLLAYRGCAETAAPCNLSAIREYWLENQRDYFGKKARWNKKEAEKLDTISTFLFRLGFFAVTPAMLIIHGMKLGGDTLDPWMQVATPLIFVISGALKFYAERMLYAEQAKQYARMYGVFTKSLQLLDSGTYDKTCQREIILAVGKEALAENGDWVLMHRERPIEVPQG
ncbi:MAG: hypothetical protein WCP20_14795 [Desulfuromonadales bacterium]